MVNNVTNPAKFTICNNGTRILRLIIFKSSLLILYELYMLFRIIINFCEYLPGIHSFQYQTLSAPMRDNTKV